MKKYFWLLILHFVFNLKGDCQSQISSEEGLMIVKSKINTLPKFNRELNLILDIDSKVKSIKFIRTTGNQNPASAQQSTGTMVFDLYYIENNIRDYDDNRLVVVLFHELGHLYDNVGRTTVEREEAAFNFSISKLRKLADLGDCEPLITGLKFMKLRSTQNLNSDPHTVALKKLVLTESFKDNEKYIENGCSESSETSLKKINKDKLIEKMKKDFRINRDSKNQSELYYHENTPDSEGDYFFCYITKSDNGQISLRLRIQYDGNPITVTDYLVQTDTREIVFAPSAGEQIVRGIKLFKYYSFYDCQINRFKLKAIMDIISSKKNELTYFGSNGKSSRKIKNKEIEALQATLQLYELLGGDMNIN